MENIVQIVEAVMSQPKDFDLLIVDDNSPDGTASMVKELQNTYNTPTEKKLHLLQRAGKLGLGTAYIEGFHIALRKGYDYVLEMDADFSHDPRAVSYTHLRAHETPEHLV